MHHQGDPQTMQKDPRHDDVLVEVYRWLEARIEAAEMAGIARDKILVDPGIGFGKSVAHNLELINGLALLHGFGCPIVFGASRKRMIGALSNEAPADRRLSGSLALALKAVEQGAQLIRVHDVPETVQALKLWRGLRDAALTSADGLNVTRIGPSGLVMSRRPAAGSNSALTAPSRNRALGHFSRSRKKRANLPSETGSSLIANNGCPSEAMPTPFRM
jgi:hypothetical protein